MRLNRLKSGDIVFFSSSAKTLHSETDVHVCIVAKNSFYLYLLDLSAMGLRYFKTRNIPENRAATVFYLPSYDRHGDLFDAIAINWHNDACRVAYSRSHFNQSFLYRHFFRSSHYGEKARRYVLHLVKECRAHAPQELISSPVLCSYIPIALCQAVYGFRCAEIMALDALNTTPHILVNYLMNNQHWDYELLSTESFG